MKYEGHMSYQSKDMANVKVFTDKQNRQTNDQTKGQKLYAPDLLMYGHKKLRGSSVRDRTINNYTDPLGGTRHTAASSLTASNIVVGSAGSIVLDSIVRASSCLIISIKPN